MLDDSPFNNMKFSKLLRNQFSKGYTLDKEYRQFLYLLHQGIPSKEIRNHLPWSLSKVDKKKRILREQFGVEDKNTYSPLTAVRNAEFL